MSNQVHSELSKIALRGAFFVLAFSVIFILILSPKEAQSLTTRVCDPQIYHGVLHCSDDGGNTHVIIVDLTNPHVRVQTVLPLGPNGECNSVNHDDKDSTSNCPGPTYPFERVTSMLERYVSEGAVAIINTDYFGCDPPDGTYPCGGSVGDHGAQGLAVRNEERLDGPLHGVDNDIAVETYSLAISPAPANIPTIGIPGSQDEVDSQTQDKYYNSVGGSPLIVKDGNIVSDPCNTEVNPEHPYGDRCSQLSQSAVGLADDGRMVLITASNNAEAIAGYLTTNHNVETALKFDGGGSARLAWVDNAGTIQSFGGTGENRPVAEGLLVFSEKITYEPFSSVDVALIIDSSGSMDWNDPGNKRLNAASAYLTASLPGDYVGIVDFDGGARLASPLLQLPDNKDVLNDAIDTIDSSGGTNIGLGVQEGCNALVNSTSGNTVKAAILLTDGEGGFDNQDSCFSDRGWPIYTFGIGDADEALLQEIASDTGGEFASLPTLELVCEFQQVRSKIADIEPGPCDVYHIGPLEITIFYYIVPSGQVQMSFSTSWVGSDIEMSLISPSGRVIDRNTVAPDVIHDLGATFEIYTVLYPEPGEWEVRLFGADVPEEGEDVVLGISTIPSSVLDVDIDIRPNVTPNKINLTSQGSVQVAVLSQPDFDATTEVERETLTFGHTGDEDSLLKRGRFSIPRCFEKDVNNDGLNDLVCHFKIAKANFELGDTVGILKGETISGIPIEGSDSVVILTRYR